MAASNDPNGPAGDYPVVIGEPFAIDGTVFTPADTLNYDEVGYAVAEHDAGFAEMDGVTISHRTLPLPSYVEITALDTGTTILARTERRGPMTKQVTAQVKGQAIAALSKDAMAALGIASATPVRIRRVNPPESERAKLRRGETATQRMATPQTLLRVLKRKLERKGEYTPDPLTEIPIEPPNDGGTDRSPDNLGLNVETDTSPVSSAVANRLSERAGPGRFMIQAAAFASRANADRLAAKIDGSVENAGRYHRVRVGPFDTRKEADTALAKIRAAGYRDAMVQTVD